MLQRHLNKVLLSGFAKECRTAAGRRRHFGRKPAAAVTAERRASGSTAQAAPAARLPTPEQIWSTTSWLSQLLEDVGAAYTYQGPVAAYMQGVQLPGTTAPLDIQAAVQWDFAKTLHQQLVDLECGPSMVEAVPGGEQFCLDRGAVHITLNFQYNVVVAMDANRVACPHPGSHPQQLWVQSLHAVRRLAGPDLAAAVTVRLAELQQDMSRCNDQAWAQQDTYPAWLQRFGSPGQAAARIARDPTARLAPLHHHTGPLKGARVANLFGSYGTKAVAMALLGADVTVFDLSASNARYAQDLAAAAGVSVNYVVGDVLKLQQEELSGNYLLVVMELGVLHYLIDLQPLMQAVAGLLTCGGRLVLREFHPISTKLISSKGKKHKVTGNYFSQDLCRTSVAHAKHTQSSGDRPTSATSQGEQQQQQQQQQQQGQEVRLRQWTLGEVITAVADAGLVVTQLIEEPGVKLHDMGLPKIYTLVAFRQ